MRTWTLLAALAISGVCSADGMPTQLIIPGWKIESNESLFVGKRHSSYPLINLVDQNPWTTWVHSGKNYPTLPKTEIPGLETGPLRLTFEPRSAVEIDEIRLMNGYNKSEELYRKNSRVVEVKIYDQDVWNDTKEKPIRTVELDEEMGFRSIKLPRKKYEKITVVFSKISKGETDDLCVSEVMFRNAGKNLIQKPSAFFASDGADCGCDMFIDLFALNGKRIGQTAYSGYETQNFSPDGKSVLLRDPGNRFLRLLDLDSTETIKQVALKKSETVDKISWKSNDKVVANVWEGRKITLMRASKLTRQDSKK